MNKLVLNLIGEINEDMFLAVTSTLDKLEAKEGPSEIIIRLNSQGGAAYDALAIAGRLRASSVFSICEVFGACMSAATIILAAGDRRRMSREAWIMLHDNTDRFKGQVTELSRAVSQMETEEQQWANLLESYTDTPEATWRKLSKQTTYLSATQAFQLGLVDEIIRGKK